MKKMLYAAMSAAFLAAAVYPQDRGADARSESKTTAPASGSKLGPLNKASTFLGATIKNAEGKQIGKVQDLVLDPARGQIAYAVISVDGAQGNSRSVAVPMTALKPSESHLVLNMSEPVLAASEGLTEGEWPGLDAFSVNPPTAIGGPPQTESGSSSSSSSAARAKETSK